MSAPAWSFRPAIPVRWRPRCAACATTSPCASAWAPPPARPLPRTRSGPGRRRCRARSQPRAAASVGSPMRRTILLALLATLLCAPAARAADTTTKIWRDCQDDVLDGHYTVAQLREARSPGPADGVEYSSCTDLLSRTIAAMTTSSSHSGAHNGGGGSGGGTGGGGTGGGGTGSGSAGGSGGGESADSAPAAPITPSTPADQQALTEAAIHGDNVVKVDGKPVMPGGASRLAADVGRNSLPTSLVIVLIMLGLAAVLGGGRRIRDRVFAHRHP